MHVHRLLFEVWLDGAFGLVAPPAGAPPHKAWRCQTIRLRTGETDTIGP